MSELKPCPFCGGEAEFDRRGTNKVSCIVRCTDCGCTLETSETFSSGESWNTRTQSQWISYNGFHDIPPQQTVRVWLSGEKTETLARVGIWSNGEKQWIFADDRYEDCADEITHYQHCSAPPKVGE